MHFINVNNEIAFVHNSGCILYIFQKFINFWELWRPYKNIESCLIFNSSFEGWTCSGLFYYRGLQNHDWSMRLTGSLFKQFHKIISRGCIFFSCHHISVFNRLRRHSRSCLDLGAISDYKNTSYFNWKFKSFKEFKSFKMYRSYHVM